MQSAREGALGARRRAAITIEAMTAVIIEAMTWRRAAVIEVDSREGKRGGRAEMAEIALELRLDETRGGAVEGPLEGGERLLLLACET